jgi:GNAT superfamily N-acetyltransferase
MASSSNPSSSALPHHSSPSLSLVLATPSENHAQTLANSAEWSGPLNQETYMRREAHLLDQDLTRDGGLRAWVLIDTSTAKPASSSTEGGKTEGDAEKRGRILCGCETLRKRALVRERDGTVKEVVAYGVCSVFCREEYRGRGYAGRMMEELGRKLETMGSDQHDPETNLKEKPLFSVLYSDIGKHFYAARGWKAFPSTHIALPVPRAVSELLRDRTDILPKADLLSPADLPELCALDTSILHSRLSSLPLPKTTISLLPDHATIAWHHAREDFFARNLCHQEAPEAKGALVRFDRPFIASSVTTEEFRKARIWCYFHRVWTSTPDDPKDPNTLYVLRFASDNAAIAAKLQAAATSAPATAADTNDPADKALLLALQALLEAARFQAFDWQMRQVKIWSPPDIVVQAASRLLETEYGTEGVKSVAQVVRRKEDSIASLRWFGEGGEKDEEEGGGEMQVEWWGNEKFGWC